MSKSNHPQKSDWRDIPQAKRGPATSKIARRRKFARTLKLSAFCILLFGGIGIFTYSLYYAGLNLSELNFIAGDQKVEHITFATDGVLNANWVCHEVGVSRGTAIASLDLFAIKKQLEHIGQVKSAVISRNFPGELAITLKERVPLLRAVTLDKNGKYHRVLIDRDGIVYSGVSYDAAELRKLPYIGGVRFQRNKDNTIRPISNMGTIARLLDTARERIPELYNTWTVVNCNGIDGGLDKPNAQIRIQGKLIKELVFKPGNFERQIERLAEIVQYVQHTPRSIESIDLSYLDQAVVRYSDSNPHL